MNSLPSATSTARRARLREWIETHHNGSQAAFVRKTGINQGELSLLLRRRTLGEKRARAIEKLADMPTGYLVNPLPIEPAAASLSGSAVALPPDEAELLRHYRRCSPALRPAALAAVRALAKQSSSP